MPQTRKLAAILADVVGYSRLMGEDEAGTAHAVRETTSCAAAVSTPRTIARAIDRIGAIPYILRVY